MIGIDIVKTERIAQAAENGRFIERVFTPAEILYWREKGSRPETLAGLFAAKEAVSKALGTGVRGFGHCDIEIMHGESGAPQAILYHAAKELAGTKTVSVSISHDGGYAVAAAMIV